jgi:hypothetical protein
MGEMWQPVFSLSLYYELVRLARQRVQKCEKKVFEKRGGGGGREGVGVGGREGERGGKRGGEVKRNHVVKSNQDKKIQVQVVFMCIFLFLGKGVQVFTHLVYPLLTKQRTKD